MVGATAVVLTSPPLFAADVTPAMLEGYDVIYVDLHGQPQSVYLYSGADGPGEQWAALSAKTVCKADLTGTVVIATTCYLPQTHFVEAFLDAGAKTVIGGDGQNWGTRRRLSGAQLLARRIIAELREGDTPMKALKTAKRKLRKSPWRLLDWAGTRDALEFQIYTREQKYGTSI